jgi:hypothetical protein
VRLPDGVQADEHDAQIALRFIQPDQSITVNVRPSADAVATGGEGGVGLPCHPPQAGPSCHPVRRLVAPLDYSRAASGLPVPGSTTLTSVYPTEPRLRRSVFGRMLTVTAENSLRGCFVGVLRGLKMRDKKYFISLLPERQETG